MANYANSYVAAITERERQTRPWKFSFGAAWQYDDNVVLKPDDTSIAIDIAQQADTRYVYTAQAEYEKRFSEKFGLKNQYMFYYGKQNKLSFYNQFTHTYVIQPSFYFKNAYLAFPTAYSYTIIDDRSYLSTPSTSAIYDFMVGPEQMGQVYLKYQNENYRWSPVNEDENRDSNDVLGGFGCHILWLGMENI